MEPLIMLIVWIVVFAIAAYGIFWACQSFQMPKPVLWVCGALLIIVILLFLASRAPLQRLW